MSCSQAAATSSDPCVAATADAVITLSLLALTMLAGAAVDAVLVFTGGPQWAVLLALVPALGLRLIHSGR